MLVRDGDWSAATSVARVFGGQGTINVNSWSPDDMRFAFVAYPWIEFVRAVHPFVWPDLHDKDPESRPMAGWPKRSGIPTFAGLPVLDLNLLIKRRTACERLVPATYVPQARQPPKVKLITFGVTLACCSPSWGPQR